MPLEIIELSAADPMPEAFDARGVTPLPAAERALHAPDRHLLAVKGMTPVARCSCWWSGTAAMDGEPIGVIGHYAASDAGAGVEVLSHACARLAEAGRRLAVGPMDGNTWRRYRFVVERGPEPPFFLEPDNPDDCPRQWGDAGFTPLAGYTSALNDDLSREDARTPAALERLRGAGITIRAFDPGRADADLRRLYALSLDSFRRNFLYSPIGEAEFLAQNRAVLPFVKPELMLFAERGDSLAGFIFGVPDALQARRGAAVDTVILKTIAVDPSMAGMGLGGALIDLVQREARQLGFRRAIHALMHETNVSRTISDRYACTIRRYTLFSRPTTRG